MEHTISFAIHVSIVQPGPFRTNFASASLPEAKCVIEDYKNTAGVFREKLKSVHGKQEGDSIKAAQAIINLTYKSEPSLRLPLGKIPLVTIRMKLESVQKDLETNKEIAESVIF
ncbi:Rossmann-fold NAD(P)-binding domain-containing protein [Aquimarina agarilytica]|uniref:estradiol 17-beta-dehydrogenase n=1 Tax=Aquimarina agarilytica TaxID=1087449 RepID=UPI0002887B90|nr:estradiol 17-beta-dehydrogenase [Aquimarina agarilytica]